MVNDVNEDFKSNNKTDKVKIVEQDGYYGTTREWLVGRGKLGDFIFGDQREEKEIMTLDFGHPYAASGRKEPRTEYVNISRYDIEEITKKVTDDVILSGYRGNIADEVIRKVKEDYEVEYRFRAYTKASLWNNHITERVFKKGYGEYAEISTEEDIKPYLTDNEYDTKLIGANFYAYRLKGSSLYGEEGIKYIIEKYIKNEYTYCTKLGKSIIPDKYLNDGKAGVEAWKTEKAGKNKNNSIEKQILKKIKIEKRNLAFDKFNTVMKALLKEGTAKDWSMVQLSIDGRWATNRRLKTINKYIFKGNDKELITLSEEEIEKRCKSYWVKELMDAIERIKKEDFTEK